MKIELQLFQTLFITNRFCHWCRASVSLQIRVLRRKSINNSEPQTTFVSDKPRGLPITSSLVEHIFPTLTPAQIRRIAAHGHMRTMQSGEVLVEQGDREVPFFVVVSGEVEVVRPSGAAETLITVHRPGQFSGEVSMLSGRPAIFRGRAAKPGELIQLDRQHMMALVQTDAELSDILMRAFILRRVELVAAGVGDIVLIGSTHSAGTLRI